MFFANSNVNVSESAVTAVSFTINDNLAFH